MATYDGLTLPSLTTSAATSGGSGGYILPGLITSAARSYTFAPNANAGNRPTSSQIYPRGVR